LLSPQVPTLQPSGGVSQSASTQQAVGNVRSKQVFVRSQQIAGATHWLLSGWQTGPPGVIVQDSQPGQLSLQVPPVPAPLTTQIWQLRHSLESATQVPLGAASVTWQSVQPVQISTQFPVLVSGLKRHSSQARQSAGFA